MPPVDIYMYDRRAPYFSVRGTCVVYRLSGINGDDLPRDGENMAHPDAELLWRWVGEVDSPAQAIQYASGIDWKKIEDVYYVSTAKANPGAVVHGMYGLQWIGHDKAENVAIQPAESLTKWKTQPGGVPAAGGGGGGGGGPSSFGNGDSGGGPVSASLRTGDRTWDFCTSSPAS